jgi:hypothetical protein
MYPIYIFGTGGTGVSMLIWMIKKIINPDYFVDDPISNLYNAHNQPLLQHWGVNNDSLDKILSGAPEKERIVHCEPNSQTWGKTPPKSTIVISAKNTEDLQKIAVLRKCKIDIYHDMNLNTLYNLLLENSYTSMSIPDAFNMSTDQLITRNIEPLIVDLCSFLDVENTLAKSNIIDVHSKWQDGNELLFNQYMSKFNKIGEVQND